MNAPILTARPGAGSGFPTLLGKELLRFWKVSFQTIAAPVITALLYLVIFAQVLQDRIQVYGTVPYTAFLIPGLMMMSMLQNAFANSSSSLIISKMNGCLVDLLLAPISTAGFLLAMAAAAMTRGVLVSLSVALAMMAFVPLSIHHPEILAFHTIFGGISLGLVGVLTGMWAEKFDHVATITNFVVAPLSFLSGTFYSVQNLDPAWHFMIDFNPIFYMIDGMRYAMTDHHDGDIRLGMAVVLGVTVVLWTLCYEGWKRGYGVKH
jgi:ABC-2 type transport system permease protein